MIEKTKTKTNIMHKSLLLIFFMIISILISWCINIDAINADNTNNKSYKYIVFICNENKNQKATQVLNIYENNYYKKDSSGFFVRENKILYYALYEYNNRVNYKKQPTPAIYEIVTININSSEYIFEEEYSSIIQEMKLDGFDIWQKSIKPEINKSVLIFKKNE